MLTQVAELNFKIAEKNNVNLEYEASVAGGVPIIRSIKESLIANKINNKEREVIAKNGKKKYFKYFNSNIVSQYIVDKTFEFKTRKTFWEK